MKQRKKNGNGGAGRFADVFGFSPGDRFQQIDSKAFKSACRRPGVDRYSDGVSAGVQSLLRRTAHARVQERNSMVV